MISYTTKVKYIKKQTEFMFLKEEKKDATNTASHPTEATALQ